MPLVTRSRCHQIEKSPQNCSHCPWAVRPPQVWDSEPLHLPVLRALASGPGVGRPVTLHGSLGIAEPWQSLLFLILEEETTGVLKSALSKSLPVALEGKARIESPEDSPPQVSIPGTGQGGKGE